MALVNCSNCGKEVSDKAKICPSCGYQLNNDVIIEETHVICTDCGLKIPYNLDTCPKCGHPVSLLIDNKNEDDNIATETANIIDNTASSKHSNESITETQKKNMGCGIAIIVIIIIIIIASLFGGEDHNDGKCDICGKSGAIQASSNAELCLDHIIKANNDYYKDNKNYGGF